MELLRVLGFVTLSTYCHSHRLCCMVESQVIKMHRAGARRLGDLGVRSPVARLPTNALAKGRENRPDLIELGVNCGPLTDLSVWLTDWLGG